MNTEISKTQKHFSNSGLVLKHRLGQKSKQKTRDMKFTFRILSILGNLLNKCIFLDHKRVHQFQFGAQFLSWILQIFVARSHHNKTLYFFQNCWI